MPGPVSESYSGPLDPEEVELRAAIRAFTVEGPHSLPNGNAERALAAVQVCLGNGDLGGAKVYFVALCEALANDTRALRIAAEKFFGGDFRKPGV